MESNNTEEIICTNCGRPNLPEAVKCWYCQIPLKKEEEDSQPSLDNIPPEASKPQKDDQQAQIDAENEGEDIPDWLRRIREKKKEEQAKEEEKDQWQQQNLFIKGEKPADAAPKAKKKPDKPAGKSQRPAPKKKAAPQAKPVVNKEAQSKEKPKSSTPTKKDAPNPDNQEEDLPDGFIKFDSKNS
jgi:hypothetical protein